MSVDKTKNRTRRTARKNESARTVQQTLLELTYRLHATRVVGMLPTNNQH